MFRGFNFSELRSLDSAAEAGGGSSASQKPEGGREQAGYNVVVYFSPMPRLWYCFYTKENSTKGGRVIGDLEINLEHVLENNLQQAPHLVAADMPYLLKGLNLKTFCVNKNIIYYHSKLSFQIVQKVLAYVSH